MRILLEEGNKFSGDKIIKLTCEQEAFTIVKMCEVINLLALNEYKRLRELSKKTINPEQSYQRWSNNFFLSQAINLTLRLASENTRFREWLNNDDNLLEFVRTFYPNENEIRKKQHILDELSLQTKLLGDDRW